jgi:hypothetical protein
VAHGVLTTEHNFVTKSCFEKTVSLIRFDTFQASDYNEVFSGYQPGKVVQFFRDPRFEDHLCPRPQFNNPEEEDRDGLRNVGL